MKQPVIIDCDPGLDDAIALLVAMQSEKLDIRAITTVGGNSSVDLTSMNALKLVHYTGFNIKVAKGAPASLIAKVKTAPHVHGKTGLGNVELPVPNAYLYEKSASETIYEEALNCEGKLRIIATGPLTNIAVTLLAYPDIKDKISHITIMGGGCFIGNKTPVAEANIANDAEAAKIVFSSGIPIVMCGLDVTYKALVYKEDIEKIRSIGTDIAKIAAEFMDFHGSYHKNAFDFNGDPVHDACAVAYEIDSTLITTKKCHVDIETQGEFTKGQTVVDYYNVLNKEPNIDVAFDIDRERFVDLIYNSIKKYK